MKDKALPNRPKLSLPPGHQERGTRAVFRKRNYLLDKYARYGPVFAETDREGLHVYVIGFPSAHKLLVEHVDQLDVVWMDLNPLFAGGDIRKLTGVTHQTYRRSLLKAINSEVLLAAEQDLGQIITQGITSYYLSSDPTRDSKPYREALNDIATSLLVRIFYGAEPGHTLHKDLVDLHNQLGPDGLAWNIGRIQIKYFAKIKTLIEQNVIAHTDAQPSIRNGILQAIDPKLLNDEIVIGNLIYMVETGRADIQALLRWVTKFACDLPQEMSSIANEPYLMSQFAGTHAESFIKETLRMAQSERVTRTVNQDIKFEGMLIPKGASLTLCLWEAHQLSESFEKPGVFDPQRFRQKQIGAEKYSPFGLGIHRCPMNNYIPKIAGLFLSLLAKGYEVEGINNGQPMRGMFHWQPANDFTVRLQARSEK
jgi:cytochrome P450